MSSHKQKPEKDHSESDATDSSLQSLMEEYLNMYPPSLDAKGLERGEEKKPATTARGRHIEARLDLHGLTLAEAENRLRRFLASARNSNKKLVLVIIGKGIHSTGKGPVLPVKIREGFNHGKYGKIRSFKNADAKSGGQGALLISL